MFLFRVMFVSCALFGLNAAAQEKIKALIVDGQNNHAWKTTTPLLKQIFESSGRFTVDVATSPEKGKDMSAFSPDFKAYGVVVSNYNGDEWPAATKKAFVDYVSNGGGFVVYHAADNAFSRWPEYNQMIGLGGWGGRNEISGPYLRLREGKWVADTSKGGGGTHGAQHEFVMVAVTPDHPIMKGLPPKWKHTKDELYGKLRGPAKDVTVLSYAFSDPATKGTGENEPLLMTIPFGKGRVFHTALGHGVEAVNGLGFQVTLLRGAEWAATGQVTLPAPAAGELTEDKAAVRPVAPAK